MKYFLLLLFSFLISPVASFSEEATVSNELFGIDVLQLQISDMERIVKEQTNTIENLNNSINKIQNEFTIFKSDSELRFKDIEQQNKNLENIIKQQKEILKDLQQQQTIVQNKEKEKEIVKDINKNVITTNDNYNLDKKAYTDAEKMYDDAIKLIRVAKYQEGRNMLFDFLKQFPDNNLAGNAKYWIGETYYVLNDYENASIVFAGGVSLYPDNIKAPDNLFKLGLSLKALKKNTQACTAFLSLPIEFPKADKNLLNKAKIEADNLKCK